MPTKKQIGQVILNLYREERLAWLELAKAWARHLAKKQGEVSADDIWEKCPIPEGMNIDRRIMGLVFKELKLVGYGKSRRKINHGRTIGKFTIPPDDSESGPR